VIEEYLNPPVSADQTAKDEGINDEILTICEDIIKRGYDTEYSYVYDAIYEMVEEDSDDID
jgi:hypothetical protein